MMLFKIYKNSPIWMQHLFVSGYGYYWKQRRFGAVFHQKLKEFKNNERQFSKEYWQEYQTNALRNLLIHAFKNVPYYTEKYSKAGFKESDFYSFQLTDLKSLPILTKEELRKEGRTRLLSKNKSKGIFVESSGSTGTPVSIYMNTHFQQTWQALYEVRVRNWAGVAYTQSRAMIGGRRVLPSATMNSPFYRYNSAENQYYFSAYHISKETTPFYLQELIHSKSEYLVGYAVSIYTLAFFALELGCETPQFRAVLTSSEQLTHEMRKVIEKTFHCKVFDAYSGVEACGLISENTFGELLVSPEAGILEIVDDTGKEVSSGNVGQVISTGLLNYDQPLLRYAIGDQIQKSTATISKSELPFQQIEKIQGRDEDVIVGTDGRRQVRFHSVFNGIKGLQLAQVIQQGISNFVIKLVVDTSYHKTSETTIKEVLESQLGKITVTFRYVTMIEKEKNGKFKAVKSLL